MRYLAGAATYESALLLLNKIVSSALYPDAEKARCCMRFIERYIQYCAAQISGNELLLSLRDLVLFTGRLQIPVRVSELVLSHGKEYDLIRESGDWVTCMLQLPTWFKDKEFVRQVYSFESDSELKSKTSVADDLLRTKTIYCEYKSFEQKAAVYSALKLPKGNTLLIALPTGGGKSLITQMLAAIDTGLTLVVVPTVALAIDQYNAAKSRLMSTLQEHIYCYRGNQDKKNYMSIINAIRGKTARLLFTSPEAILRNTIFFKELRSCAELKYLQNLVVDEAHVVPDWGTLFRPDFQILSVALKQWRVLSNFEIRTYLLSATLSDEVVSALYSLYGEETRFFEFRCDALRPEPRFCFYRTKTHSEQDEKLLDLVKYLPKPVVVYVLEPDDATRIQKLLRGKGYKNVPTFTGKTKDADRDDILRNWKTGKYDIVVATSAFGLGVDKPDVRTIIHKCVPENLSRFYQEVGRAGRDNMPSLSVLLPYDGKSDGASDLTKAFGLVNKRVLRVENIVIRWFSMLRSTRSMLSGDEAILDTSTPPTSFSEKEVEYAGDRNVAWNVNMLMFLHRTQFIDIQEVFYSAQTRSFHFKVLILRLGDMSNEEIFFSRLESVRKKELDGQLEGYFLMSELVKKPTQHCWGTVFKKLFPLARERCNGCPRDNDPLAAIESTYKLRANPGIPAPPDISSTALKRFMGGYSRFIIRNPDKRGYSADDVKVAIEKMNAAGVGCLIVPVSLAEYAKFDEMVLTHDEFIFFSERCPYIFAAGVMCIFSYDATKNDLLFRCCESLEQYGYKRIYYCDEDMLILSENRRLSSFIDCYSKDADNV